MDKNVAPQNNSAVHATIMSYIALFSIIGLWLWELYTGKEVWYFVYLVLFSVIWWINLPQLLELYNDIKQVKKDIDKDLHS